MEQVVHLLIGNKANEQNLKTSSCHKTQIEALSTFSRQIFQELLDDNLIMKQIQLSTSSNNENIRIENATINHLQHERAWLIEYLLYLHGVDDLLITWSKIIHRMALDS
ncbi:1050_t:CDS:2, partial [Acaulospora morrowiae]